MAEETLRKLEEQLQCAVCLEMYTDPKQLQCHHIYCKECLGGLTKTDEQGKVSVTCPNCREVTLITDSGLQPAFQIKFQESFKKAKTFGLDSDVSSKMPNIKVTNMCCSIKLTNSTRQRSCIL